MYAYRAYNEPLMLTYAVGVWNDVQQYVISTAQATIHSSPTRTLQFLPCFGTCNLTLSSIFNMVEPRPEGKSLAGGVFYVCVCVFAGNSLF